MSALEQYLSKVTGGDSLSETEMEAVMTDIMEGKTEDAQIETLLTSLADRGETVEEITGAAKVMRKMVSSIQAPEMAMDCCGTGGDGAGTYNISTAVALIAASCGVPIAKHGNRAASSKSGAADVLEALGVNLSVPHERLETALEKLNFCFLMAPSHHAAMKHVMPVRKKLGRRTIFNLLGPLANPAGTKFQLIGVFDKKWVRPMAEVLNNLGTTRAWVVHGHDGLDEITVTDKTDVAVLNNGAIKEATISPEDFGMQKSAMDDLKGGDAEENAKALQDLLMGKKGAYRDIVLINTAVVLAIHGKAKDLKHGVSIAEDAIYQGKALHVLNEYAALTRSFA